MSETATRKKNTRSGVGEESMIVRMSSLDNMLQLAGEVIIVSSNLNAMSRQIREGVPISRSVSNDIKDLAITSSRISSDLHNLVSNVRNVDMSDLFARFQRLARDTSRRLGKAIRFEVEGQDICIDKKMSEKIYDPIAHQIRNAMSHGIEDEQTRKAAGKDPVGTVRLSVRNMENSTVIEISDDGGGIDTEKVREKVIQMNLCEPGQAEKLRDQELFEYLFLPGFSTSQTTSSTSGRGVGLDVVKSVMDEVNAEIKIETRPGTGTTFSFILPKVTAVNISDALLVRANENYFAFPIASVVASSSVPISQVNTTTGRGKTILYLGGILPLFDLLEVFGEFPVSRDQDQDHLRVLIVEHKSKKVAYVVSDFLNPQKIVISEFDEKIKVPGLLGTAILSGRQLAMVIDLPHLVEQTIGTDNEVDKRGVLSQLQQNAIADEDDFFTMTPDKPARAAASEPEKDFGPSGDTLDLEIQDSAFLNEVESMLSTLNKELLTFDEKRDRETADSVFRMMHSIKGNLTMCGAEESASIAHRTETLLTQAREGKLELKDEVFDVFFDSCSYLEDVVNACLKNQKPPQVPEKLEQGLSGFEQQKSEDSPDRPIDIDSMQIPLDSTGEFYLSSRRRDGTNLYQLKIEFEKSDQPDFLVAYLILRRIQGVADVLGTLPGMSEIESGICSTGLAALIASRDQNPELLKQLETNLKTYYGVKRFEANPFA